MAYCDIAVYDHVCLTHISEVCVYDGSMVVDLPFIHMSMYVNLEFKSNMSEILGFVLRDFL